MTSNKNKILVSSLLLHNHNLSRLHNKNRTHVTIETAVYIIDFYHFGSSILNAAAKFAHLIKNTLVLIVSFVLINAASVDFRHPLLPHLAMTSALSQFGKCLME